MTPRAPSTASKIFSRHQKIWSYTPPFERFGRPPNGGPRQHIAVLMLTVAVADGSTAAGDRLKETQAINKSLSALGIRF